jgi:cytochrome P450
MDLDQNSAEFVANRHQHYAELRRRCPVVWNAAHGGFWMVTDHESVAAVARDNDTFRHEFDLGSPDGVQYWGIVGVPRSSRIPRQGVAEYDGRHHADMRRALNPALTPAEVARLRTRAVEVADQFLDQVVPAGRADLVEDYTTPVPAVLTLEMMGMDSANWRHYAEFFHDQETRRVGEMMAELVAFAAERRRHPTEDLTSRLVTAEIDGRLLTEEECGGVLWNLVAGGLDTTGSLTAQALHHLGTHEEHRRALLLDRSLVPSAIEEFLRFFSPSETLTRTCSRDVELGGQQLHKGDRVLISWISANHDEAVFERAEEIVLDRDNNKHLAFGLGGHRCIGAHLARMEAEVMLSRVLDRIPGYVVDTDGYRPSGNLLLNSVVSLPVTF